MLRHSTRSESYVYFFGFSHPTFPSYVTLNVLLVLTITANSFLFLSHGLWPKKFYASVPVPPAPVQVPSQ